MMNDGIRLASKCLDAVLEIVRIYFVISAPSFGIFGQSCTLTSYWPCGFCDRPYILAV